MNYEPVDSSLIEAIAYDPDRQHLGVRFRKGGRCCIYEGVPPDVHEALLGANSPGRHFLSAVRDQYKWRYE